MPISAALQDGEKKKKFNARRRFIAQNLKPTCNGLGKKRSSDCSALKPEGIHPVSYPSLTVLSAFFRAKITRGPPRKQTH
nr:hypothetical protein Itr_chr01CG20250 [Ipomoea trifida]GMC47837.1 hypothetical protein Iba_chr01aCG15150 [Ipomoea batatas]GMC52202.1 hypothetical protein Iba_chr01cCG13350 [Ipomoea batatas]